VENEIENKCRELSYRLETTTADFDAARFAAALPEISESAGWNAAFFGPNPKASNAFHAHVYWRPSRGETGGTRLQVDFHRWKPESKAKEGELFADGFYRWVGQFFTIPAVNMHIHAEFHLPLDAWQPTVVPLPMKIPFGGKQASVNGVYVKLPSQPEDVEAAAWVVMTKKIIDVQLHVDKKLEFETFNLDGDIKALASVAASLVQEKRQ
jgi:hypothetical protein